MNFFKHKLNMSKAQFLSNTLVFAEVFDDNISNGLTLEQYYYSCKKPFEEIANRLLLKSILKSSVIESPNNTQFHKEFICKDDITIKYNVFPQKIQIKHKTYEDESQVIKIAKDIIDSAGAESSICKIGINYEMFLEADINIKDYLLKDKVAKEFTSLSATPVFEIDENTILNLTIASAINSDGKKGIYFQANFDNKVNYENTLSVILDKKLRKMADEKINLIFD